MPLKPAVRRSPKVGDWVYSDQTPWLVILVHRVEAERQLLWDSMGRSVNIDDAVRLPTSPHALAKAWDRMVSGDAKRYFRKEYANRRYKKSRKKRD